MDCFDLLHDLSASSWSGMNWRGKFQKCHLSLFFLIVVFSAHFRSMFSQWCLPFRRLLDTSLGNCLHFVFLLEFFESVHICLCLSMTSCFVGELHLLRFCWSFYFILFSLNWSALLQSFAHLPTQRYHTKPLTLSWTGSPLLFIRFFFKIISIVFSQFSPIFTFPIRFFLNITKLGF